MHRKSKNSSQRLVGEGVINIKESDFMVKGEDQSETQQPPKKLDLQALLAGIKAKRDQSNTEAAEAKKEEKKKESHGSDELAEEESIEFSDKNKNKNDENMPLHQQKSNVGGKKKTEKNQQMISTR